MARKITTEDFIEEARSVHGDRYSYDCAVYTRMATKVEIICNSGHQNFWQSPTNHVTRKAGCPACSGCGRVTPEAFIARCVEKHGDRYDYAKTLYVNSGTEVTVSCSIHGDFSVKPHSHRGGNGCPACGDASRPTTDSYIAGCIAKHGDKYTYSKSVYVNAKTKVTVTCRLHGDFDAMPADHTRGAGCPNCAETGYKGSKPGHFYVLSDNSNTTKIGITNRSVEARRKKIVRSSGLGFTERFSFRFENGAIARALEKRVLACLKSFYAQPTKVFDGSTEAFLSVDLIKLLQLVTEQITILTDTTEILKIENEPTPTINKESEPNYV